MLATVTTPAVFFVFVASIVSLVYFSEKAVEKIIALTHYFGFSATFVGLTIFSIATSLPELFAHISASIGIVMQTLDYHVASATVVGANVGSDIFQQTVILGVAIVFLGKAHFSRNFTLTAFIPMILAATVSLVLALDGVFSRLDGAILVLLFIVYMKVLYSDTHAHVQADHSASKYPLEDSLLALVFLGLMLFSAKFLLFATENLVLLTGLGGSLIGALTLGVAAASPELFTALTTARKKETGLSVGVLIGSNITNPLLALGIGAIISTYSVPLATIRWDIPFKILSPLILLYILHRSLPKDSTRDWFAMYGDLGVKTAIYLFVAYAVFVTVRILFYSSDILV